MNWLQLMSLDVIGLDPKSRRVRFRYSVDSAAGAFTGDAELPVGDAGEMAGRLFDDLKDEVSGRIGLPRGGPARDNRDEIELELLPFLGSFSRALDAREPEPLELALAETAGVDFFSNAVSLFGKELAERVQILIRRASSNLKYGYAGECLRDLEKAARLAPGNSRVQGLRAELDAGLASRAQPPSVRPTAAPRTPPRRVETAAKPMPFGRATKRAPTPATKPGATKTRTAPKRPRKTAQTPASRSRRA